MAMSPDQANKVKKVFCYVFFRPYFPELFHDIVRSLTDKVGEKDPAGKGSDFRPLGLALQALPIDTFLDHFFRLVDQAARPNPDDIGRASIPDRPGIDNFSPRL